MIEGYTPEAVTSTGETLNTPDNPQEELLTDLINTSPETFQREPFDEYDIHADAVAVRDEVVMEEDLVELLSAYGLNDTNIEIREHGTVRLPVISHFQMRRLPEGYAYKGSAARSLLLRSLGKDPNARPRDIDLIRTAPDEPVPNADQTIAQRFMPEDFTFGDGIEVVDSPADYLAERDFTINELYATDTEIIATEACIRDTARGIIRITDYERDKFNGPGQKMLAKMLRFYAEGIQENAPVVLADLSDGTLEGAFISPFWLSVQLDRSYQKGSVYAEAFVKTLQSHHQLPPHITTPEEAATYLTSLLIDSNFYFRFAPTQQLETEKQLVDIYFDKYEDLIEEYDRPNKKR